MRLTREELRKLAAPSLLALALLAAGAAIIWSGDAALAAARRQVAAA